MYTTKNFKTKKALKEAVKLWTLWVKAGGENATVLTTGHMMKFMGLSPEPVRLFAPGIFAPKRDGIEYVEGPHYPKPHTWYAKVEVKDGIVVKVT
jgi:hypothetical protein